jgi:phosphoenolpyruvate carboxylase
MHQTYQGRSWYLIRHFNGLREFRIYSPRQRKAKYYAVPAHIIGRELIVALNRYRGGRRDEGLKCMVLLTINDIVAGLRNRG